MSTRWQLIFKIDNKYSIKAKESKIFRMALSELICVFLIKTEVKKILRVYIIDLQLFK